MKKILILIIIICTVLVVSTYAEEFDNVIHTSMLNKISEEYSNTYLKVGDVGVIDDLKIEITDVYIDMKSRRNHEGAGVISIKLKVENIGKIASGDVMIPYTKDEPELYYDGYKMEHTTSYIIAFDDWRGFTNKYPGVITEGYISFYVPSTIDWNETVLDTHGLKWNLGQS